MLGDLLRFGMITLMGSILLGTLARWQQRQAFGKSVGHGGCGPGSTLGGGLR